MHFYCCFEGLFLSKSELKNYPLGRPSPAVSLEASTHCAQKVVPDGPGLVKFVVEVVNSALRVLWNSKYRRSVINPAQQFFFSG